MTTDIAFRLGKFEEFKAFYSTALWCVNRERFDLFEYFAWSLPDNLNFQGVTGEDGQGWENIYLNGKLKTDLINNDELKLAYICGSLHSYSVKFTDTLITKHYANSYDLRDFMHQCLCDVLKSKFGFDAKYGLLKTESPNTIPGTPYIELEGEPKVIKFLKNECDKWADII